MLLPIKNLVANVKRVNKGITLLETLIALLLGSILLLAVSSLYTDIFFTKIKQKELLQLQKNTHQILNYLQQHISNAGYQGLNRENSNFSWFKQGNRAYHLEKHCLIILQDLNTDGCLGSRVKKQCSEQQLSIAKDITKEILAIKLENNGLMVLGKQNNFTPCYYEQCANYLKSCQNLQWEKIAALSDNRIEELNFSWEKPDKLITIALTLSSLKDNQIKYSATANAYLLNGD